jgi:predicted NUDIX family NTP pyrophosphohydrolase
MSKTSAGILAYRFHQNILQVLLVHPGGPFWKNKDAGVWSIPKGEYNVGEDPFTVALREFEEETGNTIEPLNVIPLSTVKLKSGKVISAWAIEGDFDQCFISSNTFELKWPPRSGRMQTFPEVDKAGWFTVEEAALKLNAAQVPLLHELTQILTTNQ